MASPPQLSADYSGKAMGNPRIRLASFLRRWWSLIALAVVGGAFAAYVYGSRTTPTYEANAQVLVEASPASEGAPPVTQLLPTYAEIVRSTPVLAFALRATQSAGTVADDTDRTRAIALANALAAGLRWYVSVTRAAPTPGADVTAQPQVRVVDRATSAVRIRPLSRLLLEFGAFAGLFGALAFALVAEARGAKVTDEDDLMEIGGLPVLGSVNGAWPRAGPSFFDPTRSSLEEAASYRRLATRISVANREEVPRSLVVVGAERSEGSWTVGVKLALVLAQDGQRVVLADFEGDSIGQFFRIDERGAGQQAVSRAEALKFRSTTLDRFTMRSGAPLVLILPRHAPRGFTQQEAEELVTLLSTDADLLIIHAPPPSHSRSTLTWARAAQAAVLVVRAEHTRRAEVEKAREGLEPVGAKLIGAVLHSGRG